MMLRFDEPFFNGQEVVLGDWWGEISFRTITPNFIESWDRGLFPLSFAQSPEIFEEWERDRRKGI